MKKFKAVLFDLDGTLVDNYTAIHLSMCEAFEVFGLEKPSYETVFRTVGGSLLITVKRLLAGTGKEESLEEISRLYLKLYQKHIFDGLKVLPFAEEFLKALRQKNIKIVCFTNKQDDAAGKVLEKLKIEKYFDAILATSLHSPRKPEPEYTQLALDAVGLPADEVLIVGDSPFDYKAALSKNVSAALVATGGDTKEILLKECPNAVGVFTNLKEIANQLFDIAL